MKNKVLIVYAKDTSEIFNRQSALGSYIHCLASILVKNGYKVKINDILFNEISEQESISVAKKGGSFFNFFLPSFLKEYIKDVRLFLWMSSLFNKIDNGEFFDIVLEFYTYGSDVGYKLSKKYSKPIVLVYDNPVLEEHSFFHSGQLFFKNKIELLEKQSLLQAHSIVVYSKAVENYLVKKTNIALPCFIHQNVDYTRFEFIDQKPLSDVINIGFIGSFLKWHKVDLLLNAFTILKKDGFNIKLFLLGNGMDYENIKKQVLVNDYVKDIEMPGFMDGKRLFEYKKKINIGIMPGSNWYGAPNKIFEYGAAKMAVIAPNTPTISHLFKNDNELMLFEQDNLMDFVEKIRFYITNEQILKSHSENLQMKIKNNYSEIITFEFYDKLFKKS